ncbi:MAG: hypothetical protein Q4C58_10345 [Eubacteriales bacterium]|nr:hypothetical protein [Eubacteriales bacterium]
MATIIEMRQEAAQRQIPVGEVVREHCLQEIDEKIADVKSRLEAATNSHSKKRLEKRLAELEADRKRTETDHTFKLRY